MSVNNDNEPINVSSITYDKNCVIVNGEEEYDMFLYKVKNHIIKKRYYEIVFIDCKLTKIPNADTLQLLYCKYVKQLPKKIKKLIVVYNPRQFHIYNAINISSYLPSFEENRKLKHMRLCLMGINMAGLIFPPRLRYLKINVAIPQECNIPSTLRKITYESNYNVALRSFDNTNVKDIILNDIYNEPLPSFENTKLRSIIFGYKYNQPLPIFPQTLRTLSLGGMFNQEIDDLRYTKIKYISYGIYYDKPLPRLPDSLKYIYLGSHFNHVIPSFPINIRVIALSTMYNVPLPSLENNKRLRSLIIDSKYEERLPKLPIQMRKLTLLYINKTIINRNDLIYLNSICIFNCQLLGEFINIKFNKINLPTYNNNIFKVKKKDKYSNGYYYLKKNLVPFMIYMLCNKNYIPYEIYNYIYMNYNFYFILKFS